LSRRPAGNISASRANHLILLASPSSGLGPHISTPLRNNAAVHHNKNRAMMSQIGQNQQCSRRAEHFCFAPKSRHLRLNG